VTDTGGAARPPLDPEEQARADFYALLARLYAAPPDAGLLRAIAGAEPLTVTSAEDAAREFARSWTDLVSASGSMNEQAAAEEYEALFGGVGRSEVSLHASTYLPRAGGNVLADLRARLAELGLGRRPGVSLFEDHLAAVCETMRVLVAGTEDIAPADFARQRDFFLAYVSSWAPVCCAAILQSPVANYYRWVGEFTKLFMAVERDSLAIE
jgi:TorA maturation chaperone TorD